MSDEKPLSEEQIQQVLQHERKKHPHTYYMPGEGEEPGVFISILSIDLPFGTQLTGKQFEDLAHRAHRLCNP